MDVFATFKSWPAKYVVNSINYDFIKMKMDNKADLTVSQLDHSLMTSGFKTQYIEFKA